MRRSHCWCVVPVLACLVQTTDARGIINTWNSMDMLQPRDVAITPHQVAVPVSNFCLVTGWSSNHHREGMCMMKWVKNAPQFDHVFFVNMGITSAQKDELKAAARVRQLRLTLHNASASYMPRHALNFEPMNTGFKAIAMEHMLKHDYFDSCHVVWWADASIRFTKRFNISSAEQRPHPTWGVKVHHNGYINHMWTHPSMYAYFGLKQADDSGWSVNGGTVAFNLHNQQARELLRLWAECNRNRECIVPTGSERWPPRLGLSTHRHASSLYFAHRDDQAALNLALLLLFGSKVLGQQLTLNLHKLPFIIERNSIC